MSSKWFLLRLALAISLITGCGLQIGEEPADPVIPSHSGGGLNCVGQIPETVSRYVEAEISDGEITAFVRC